MEMLNVIIVKQFLVKSGYQNIDVQKTKLFPKKLNIAVDFSSDKIYLLVKKLNLFLITMFLLSKDHLISIMVNLTLKSKLENLGNRKLIMLFLMVCWHITEKNRSIFQKRTTQRFKCLASITNSF